MSELDSHYYRRTSMFGKSIDEIDLEKDREDNFRRSHVCPDLQPHHRDKFECTISYDSGGGIGRNVYIKCLRCGCSHDITDYGSW